MIYKELRKSIEVWTANSDPEFLSEIDRFIRQAESRIGMLVELPAYQKTTQVTFSANMENYVLPSDYISIDFISITGYGILEKKDQSFLREAYPDTADTGRPRYYADQDDKSILLGPIPDVDYPSITIQYFSKWPSIVDLGKNPSTAGTETFLSSRFEAGLLHACLYYSALFMKDQDTAATEKQEMMDSLGLITEFGNGKAKKQSAENSNSAT